MHVRPIRTSLGSEPYGSALVCTGSKTETEIDIDILTDADWLRKFFEQDGDFGYQNNGEQ